MLPLLKSRRILESLLFALLLILSLTLSLPAPALPQEEESNDRITAFSGGKMDLDFSFNSTILHGIGSSGNSYGGGIGTVSPRSSVLLSNPAGLAFLRRPDCIVDYIPRLKPTLKMINKVFDLQKEIDDKVDDALADLRTPETEVSYPEIGASFGQEGGVYSGSVAFPLFGFGVGASFHEPFDLSMKLIETGMEVQFETEKTIGEETKPIAFKAMIDLNLAMDIGVSGKTIGVGKSIFNALGLGASLTKYDGRAFLDGKARVDGLMSYSGQEYIFNNPNDDWYNDINQSAWADFGGAGWGKKLGVSYRLGRRISLDAVLEDFPDLLLTGSMEVIENRVPALNTDGGDEVFDPTKLDIAKLTLTEFVDNKTSDSLTVHLPSSFKVGGAVKFGFLTASITYAKYTGKLGYSFLGETRGIEPKESIGIGFDLVLFKIGGMVTRADEVRAGTDDDEGRATDVLLPAASIGFGAALGKGLRADTTLIAIPAPFGRVSLSMSF